MLLEYPATNNVLFLYAIPRHSIFGPAVKQISKFAHVVTSKSDTPIAPSGKIGAAVAQVSLLNHKTRDWKVSDKKIRPFSSAAR
jgi:hypothetical protein